MHSNEPFQRPSNRTIQELKFIFPVPSPISLNASNRTIQELKYTNRTIILMQRSTSNRTIQELKFKLKGCTRGISWLPIVPYRN